MVEAREARPRDQQGGAQGQSSASQLVTEHGKTSIANQVVAKIAGTAAREISGVHDLVATGTGGAIAGLAQRVTGGASPTQGVNVEVGEREAAIDLAMTVDYGVSIPQLAEAVRRNVMERVQATCGLTVKEVNIDVTDIYLPEEQASEQRRVE